MGRGETFPYRPPPSPPLVIVTENCLSGVGCGVPYGSLKHDHMAGGEVADAEGSLQVASVDVKHYALGPAWRQLVLGFCSPWLLLSIAPPLAAFATPSYRRDGEP